MLTSYLFSSLRNDDGSQNVLLCQLSLCSSRSVALKIFGVCFKFQVNKQYFYVGILFCLCFININKEN